MIEKLNFLELTQVRVKKRKEKQQQQKEKHSGLQKT